MFTLDLYKKYEIMPALSKHQLRVAAVAKMIAGGWKRECDIEYVTRLGLLHDMGNIVKFDLSPTKQQLFGKIENVEHWLAIQKEYRSKYGERAHGATKAILMEAGLGKYWPDLESEARLYFAETPIKQLEKESTPALILMYADCQVTPRGITSFQERVEDLCARYGGGGTKTWREWMGQFEEWMQGQTTTLLSSITEERATTMFEALLAMEITTND